MKQRFPRRIVAGLLFVVLIMAQSQSQVSAVSISAKPSLVSVDVIKVSSRAVKGKVEVTVGFGLAVTHTKAPLLLTEVKVGGSSCRAVGKAKKCVVKNVSSGKTFKVVARAKNRNGYSAWSGPVSIMIKAGSTWMRTVTTMPSVATTMPSVATTVPATTTTTTLPVLRTDLTKANVLGISTVKLAKVGGISSAGVQSTRVRKYAVGDVIFKTSGIVAYAQADTSSQSGSKLLAVSTTGAVSDAISSGTAVVKDFYSAPNGNVYIVFESKVALTTGGTTCLLAVVDVSTGVPTCVDSTLDSITWELGFYNGYGNSPLQFDSLGRIYYAGFSGASRVLRRASNNSVTDLINDNVTLQDFAVLADGTVLVVGQTASTATNWLRRISSAGGIKNLFLGSVYSLRIFADGNAYAGVCCTSSMGIRKYMPDADLLEAKFWVGESGADSYNSANYCRDRNANYAFCNFNGSMYSSLFNTFGQKTFAVVGQSGMDKQLWQYYPTVEKTNVSAIKNVTLAQQVITMMILSGTSSTGSNILSLYDTSSKQETVVMDGSNEVEIYSMSYSQKKNSIMFSGLRFSDNKYVVGEVSLG